MPIPRSPEPDASLRRIQRDAAVICAAVAAVALAVMDGRPDGALGVLAGGALMAVSYWAIKGGVDAALRRAAEGTGQTGRGPGQEGDALEQESRPVRRVPVGWAALTFIARYGVIAILAWAVLVPLEAHPLGVFAGVTAPVLAIGVEAIRLLRGARNSL